MTTYQNHEEGLGCERLSKEAKAKLDSLSDQPVGETVEFLATDAETGEVFTYKVRRATHLDGNNHQGRREVE